MNKRQRKAKMTKSMWFIFSSLGLILFLLGSKMASPPAVSSLSSDQNIIISSSHATLPLFVKSQTKLLVNRATIQQVDDYINSTTSALGSMNYKETPSCQRLGNCEIHYPFADLELAGKNGNDIIQKMMTADQRSDFAVLSRKGFKALVTNVNANQDRTFLISPMEFGDESSIPTSSDDFMLGLFDGHGPVGHGTAHFVSQELPAAITTNMMRSKRFMDTRHETHGIQAALKEAFIDVDDSMPFLETSGSTAICILRIGSYLFMASTGDRYVLIYADCSW